MTIDFKYDFGDYVYFDNDRSITCTVTGFMLNIQGPRIELSYFFNGDFKTAYVEEYRLQKVKL